MRHRQTHAAPPRAVVRAQNVTNKKRKLDSEGKENSTGLAAKKTKTETKSVREEEDTGSGDDSDSDESVADQECPETEEQEDGRASSDSEEDENEPFDPSKIIHESLQKSKKKSHKPASKKKYIPQDETPEQRDLRTVFVGNLSVEVAKKRVRMLLLSTSPRQLVYIAPSKTATKTFFICGASRQNRIYPVPLCRIQGSHS